MLVQHHATLLDATCWPRLNTMLDDGGGLSCLKNSLKIHEENTEKITAVSVVFYVIKFHANVHKL